MLITINDYQRLNGIIEFASLKKKMPEIVNRLLKQFKVAQMLCRKLFRAM
jgi:regulator of nucleoside diphosphate kinase